MMARLLLAAVAVVAGRGPDALEAQQPATPLAVATLEDQFGAVTATGAWRGRVVVVVTGDRDGSAHFERWRTALRASCPPGARIVVVADVAGAPRLVRGIIRNAFPRDTAARVLLDWEGRVGRAVRGDRDALAVAVFGPDGQPRLREALPQDPAAAPVIARIQRAASP